MKHLFIVFAFSYKNTIGMKVLRTIGVSLK